jgi:hypothetical protein
MNITMVNNKIKPQKNMKRRITLLIAAAFLLSGISVFGQAVSETFKISEINPMVDNYFKPIGRALATGMGSGWTHTANVHKKLGFDVTFSLGLVNIPASAKSFNTSTIGMGNKFYFTQGALNTINGDEVLSATIRGKDIAAPTIHRTVAGSENKMAFESIDGVGLKWGASFALQAGVGLPLGTEIMGRYMPDISGMINSGLKVTTDIRMDKTMMWGVGIKHDIKQWIPVVKKVPFLEISGMLTYSQFTTGFSGDDFRFDPARFGVTQNINNQPVASTWDDQKFSINMSSFTGSLLIGASIPVFQPFIGVGFNRAKFDGGLKGNYPVFNITAAASNDPLQYNITSERDPINIVSKTTDFNFQAGARIKLGFFVFHYQFTMQEYKTHSAGVAFTFR